MKDKYYLAMNVFFVLVLLTAVSCASAGKVAMKYSEETVEITSGRNTLIPAVFTHPAAPGKTPVVLLVHGHGGNKDEAGGFIQVARKLAESGIASLRMDFAGCGENKESFITGNRLSYMIADVASCKDWLASQNNVDMNRLGILGYSMGGRIAARTVSSDAQYKAACFWSPAVFSELSVPGQVDAQELFAKAQKDGQATFETFWGYEQTLGVGWFEDMQNIPPLADMGRFTGDVLLITGSKDIVVPPAVSELVVEAAVNARSKQTVQIEGADHGYGFYSGETAISDKIVNTSAAFFKDKL